MKRETERDVHTGAAKGPEENMTLSHWWYDAIKLRAHTNKTTHFGLLWARATFDARPYWMTGPAAEKLKNDVRLSRRNPASVASLRIHAGRPVMLAPRCWPIARVKWRLMRRHKSATRGYSSLAGAVKFGSLSGQRDELCKKYDAFVSAPATECAECAA